MPACRWPRPACGSPESTGCCSAFWPDASIRPPWPPRPAKARSRDQLFDLLMSRFDAMKPHREGSRALLRHLPCDPATALLLTCATRRSMRWMLHAAGQPTTGLRGALRVAGLVAVWTWTLRAFERDESDDLSATMAALDTGLQRAHAAAGWLAGERRAATTEPDTDESMADDAEA